MIQWIINLTLSVLACMAAFLLSWPFWRDFEYWPESHVAWYIYFVLGFVLAVYVFYVFIVSLRLLFLHEAQEQAPPPSADGPSLAAADKVKVS